MNQDIYPVLLEPIVLEKPWGGLGGGSRFMPEIDPGLKVGEIWLTADGQYQSRVMNGPLAGMDLKDLVIRWGTELLGLRFSGWMGEPFPLLLKFLHASENLSVQVHPDDRAAVRLEGVGPGKTEAWYIIGADDDAGLVLGLKKAISRAGLAEAIREGRTESVLNQVKVKAGEAFYVPAGLLHAIGPGVSLFEIQQNVDITYRFYDWGRVDHQGRPRELHLEKAMEAVEITPEAITPFQGLVQKIKGGSITHLNAGRYFALDRVDIEDNWSVAITGENFRLLTVLSGQGELSSEVRGQPLELSQGRTALLPAALGDYEVRAKGGLTLLVSFVPDLKTDIIQPLQQAGFSNDEIARLAGCRRPNDITVLL